MAEIFISHIHEEADQAKALAWYIKERLFIKSFRASDRWDLPAGEDWLERILRELQDCRLMLSLLSPKSTTRPWIHFEAGAAWVAEKPIISCCHAGLEMGSLPQPLATITALALPDQLYALITAVHGYMKPDEIAPPPDPPDDPFRVAVERALRGEHFWAPEPSPPTASDQRTER